MSPSQVHIALQFLNCNFDVRTVNSHMLDLGFGPIRVDRQRIQRILTQNLWGTKKSLCAAGTFSLPAPLLLPME